MSFTIKICGLTKIEDVRAAVEAGATAVGFVFVPGAREASIDLANRVAFEFPDLERVAIVQDRGQRDLLKLLEKTKVTALQLHGSETPEFTADLRKQISKSNQFKIRLIRALNVDSSLSPALIKEWLHHVDILLFDSPRPREPRKQRSRLDLASLAAAFRRGDWIQEIHSPATFWIAGGLTPANVVTVVQEARSAGLSIDGVDVSSGVENLPGRKDHQLLHLFIQNAKGVLHATE